MAFTFEDLTDDEKLLLADNSQSAISYDDPMAAKNVVLNKEQVAFYPTPDGKLPVMQAKKAPKPQMAQVQPSQEAPLDRGMYPAAYPQRAPIDDSSLTALEKSDPDLVARYKAMKSKSGEGVSDAEKKRDMLGYADAFGGLLTDYNNSQRQDIILKNRFEDMGKPQNRIAQEKSEWRSVAPMGDKAVEEARAKQKEEEDAFFTEDKLSETQKARTKDAQMNDPSSEQSRAAREYLKGMLPPGTDTSKYESLSAAQIEKYAPGISSAANQAEARKAREQEFNLRREDMNLRRAEVAKAKENSANEKLEQLRVGDYGYANNSEDAKKMKDAVESKAKMDRHIEELIELRKKHNGGAIWAREDIARAKQLSTDAKLAYKELAKLGVLSDSDKGMLDRVIPEDPLQYNSPAAAMQGQDPTRHQLEKFRSDSDKDFQQRMATRMRDGGKSQSPKVNEIRRMTKDGRTAVFNADTKEFIRYEE